MTNGGGANEKVVLLDPALNVVDAVSRDIPVSSSVAITTPALSGCGSQSFNLSSMGISYEFINIATGIDNSFSRRVDGDCGWVKTPAISADDPNKTGSSSSATYDFSTLNAWECGGTTGSISIQVNAPDVNSLFPMTYTLGFDSDGNGLFGSNDQYTYGVDYAANSIDISNLPYGRYRITVGSNSSCNLKSFDFFIFDCYGVVLPVKLHYFTYTGTENAKHVFKFKVDEASALANVVLEGGNGGTFQTVALLYGPFAKNELTIAANVSPFSTYRLKLTNQTGVISYSQEIKITDQPGAIQFWPNPVKDKIFISLHSNTKGKLSYSIFNSTGAMVKKGEADVNGGGQVISIPANDLNKGIYYFNFSGTTLMEPGSFWFVK